MLKVSLILLLLIILLLVAGLSIFFGSLQPKTAKAKDSSLQFKAKRLLDTAIIHINLDSRLIKEAEEVGYPNINGPSLIRVPHWIEHPLGKYYLYFAHHKGAYIRMAYADSLVGPWKIYQEEILPLAEAGLVTEASKNTDFNTLRKHTSWSESIALMQIGKAAKKAYEERTKQKIKSSAPTTPHLASPEVIIDDESKQIRLYYHGVVDGSLQKSKVALSEDGLQFKALPEIISLPYLRIFPFRGDYYGLAMPGFLYRSKNGLNNFEVRKRWLFDTKIRHSGLYLDGEDLYIFYSIVGDTPERILYTRMDLSSDDWNDWKVETPSREILRPKLNWEGANQSIQASRRGEVGIPVNQLRDPDIFEDNDGSLYLLYPGAGEQGIGITKLKKE